jgi:hypothetical protein
VVLYVFLLSVVTHTSIQEDGTCVLAFAFVLVLMTGVKALESCLPCMSPKPRLRLVRLIIVSDTAQEERVRS